MDPMMALWILVIGILIGFLAGVAIIYRRGVQPWKEEAQELQHRKRSQSATYGKITEQFAPFMGQYPYKAKDFRFIGSPVDGVQFTDDAVYIVEIKSAGSTLTARQRRIKQLVEDGHVFWYTFEVNDGRQP